MPRSSAALALALAASVAAAAEPVFVEDEGVIVAEVESAGTVPGWDPETELAGFTGTCYYHDRGGGELVYRLWVFTPGTWHLRIHNRHEHPDHTLENDCWTRMDDGPRVKTFSSKGGAWTWHTRHEFGHNDKPPATYELSAGEHVFVISGRSQGFRIDRFVLYHDGVPQQEACDLARGETLGVPLPPVLAGRLPGVAAAWRDGRLGRALALAAQQVDHPEHGAAAREAADALTAHADLLRERIEGLKATEPYGALLMLNHAAERYRGSEPGDAFVATIRRWRDDPAVREAVEAERLLERLREGVANKPHRGAKDYQRYVEDLRRACEQLAERYPGTSVAERALAIEQSL